MIKTKMVALALALTGLTSCETADRSNLFDQDYYKLGVGSPPNTQIFSSYPQSDGTSVVIKVGRKFWGGRKQVRRAGRYRQGSKEGHLGHAVCPAVGVAGEQKMTSDLDIYRSANELTKQYGEAADIEAAMRTDECLAAGDMEGEAVWLRIVKAIEELQSQERPDDAKVH